ncbi:hypothetical protein [Herbaspirillum sp. ST 5-3]|uniref:hypothetical protein n=1 Tax=Oxalobacteraceae TaxID=75682 RepID=UPI0010A35CBD|nr:hypothetical protein [Herbaspirillum sp. ST 5-3]
MDGYVSKTAFAKIYGCAQSYVTKLKDLNRLVLSDDGKMVNVEESLRLIEATGDLSKSGVRERWDAYRNSKDGAADLFTAAPAMEPPPADPVPAPASPRRSGAGDATSSAYHLARTEKEQIDAQLKKIELLKLQGQIAEVAPILRAVHDTHAAARSALLQMPDRLAQMLAPETDPLRVHELLRLECERVCEVMLREIQRLRERAKVEAGS